MKSTSLLCSLFTLITTQGAVFQIGDNYSANGDGTITGNSSLVEGTGLYRQDTGASGNPSGYNAIMVGSQYGGAPIWRSVTSFDLSSLPSAPTGFEYEITDISFILEVSGGSGSNRPATLIDFYEGSFQTGALPASPLASRTFNASDSTFISTSLGITGLDLNSDTSFVITMDAPNAASNPGNNYYTFGSGLAPNNVGFSGTGAAVKAPELQITYNINPIPEPSTWSLTGLALLGLISRRKR